jgi:23S rRNA pseudouridine1911/1915/1917 synthase
MTEPLAILFEDSHCLVVAKPAGLLTQGTAAGEPTLEAEVRRYLNPGAPAAPYLGTVHRLDRPVSGVVVWAKTPKAARRLAGQFAHRAVRKEYWAIVEASGPPLECIQGQDEVWDDWLAPPNADGVAWTSAPNAPGARRATTRVGHSPGARLPAGTCWLRLWPETGRTHQLRAQAASRGCPIVGDRAYGASHTFPRGIALHARALIVLHPVLQTPLEWLAPLPSVWSEAGVTLPGSST